MEYFKLINDFVEGRLETAREQELFLAMSSDDELRIKMKQLIAINTAVKNNKKELRPEPAIRASVFSAIGVADTDISRSGASSGKAGKFFSKHLRDIKTISITSIIMLILFLLLQNTDDEVIRDRNAMKLSTENNIPYLSAGESQADTVYIVKETGNFTGTYNLGNAGITTKEKRNQNRFQSIFNSEGNDRKSGNSLEQTAPPPEPKMAHTDLKVSGKIRDEFPDDFYVQNGPDNPITNAYPIESPEVLFSGLNTAHEFDYSYDFLNGTPDKKGPVNNLSYSFVIGLSDNFQLGVQVRSEYFDQKIIDYNTIDQRLIDKLPHCGTIGILGRYNFRPEYLLNPYIQGTLGSTFYSNVEPGIIFRGGCGLNIRPVDKVSISAGFEYSLFFHKEQDMIFTSTKPGIKFGLQYHL